MGMYQNLAGLPDGWATLDSNSKVPMSNLKTGVADGLPVLDASGKVVVGYLYTNVASGIPTLDVNLQLDFTRMMGLTQGYFFDDMVHSASALYYKLGTGSYYYVAAENTFGCMCLDTGAAGLDKDILVAKPNVVNYQNVNTIEFFTRFRIVNDNTGKDTISITNSIAGGAVNGVEFVQEAGVNGGKWVVKHYVNGAATSYNTNLTPDYVWHKLYISCIADVWSVKLDGVEIATFARQNFTVPPSDVMWYAHNNATLGTRTYLYVDVWAIKFTKP